MIWARSRPRRLSRFSLGLDPLEARILLSTGAVQLPAVSVMVNHSVSQAMAAQSGTIVSAVDTSTLDFTDPKGMTIGWQSGTSDGTPVFTPTALTLPAVQDFTQGNVYRLKLITPSTNFPCPSVTLYPTIEVAPSTPATWLGTRFS